LEIRTDRSPTWSSIASLFSVAIHGIVTAATEDAWSKRDSDDRGCVEQATAAARQPTLPQP
jgi:hypothetical protein